MPDGAYKDLSEAYHDVQDLRAEQNANYKEIKISLGLILKRLGVVESGEPRGSNPQLERAAGAAIRLVEIKAEEEETKVRLAREQRESDAARRKQFWDMLITWLPRIGTVAGPLITAAVMKNCGG